MIYYVKKDITHIGMGVVCHGVNCQHKMASGVAKAIRAKWPVVYDAFMNNYKGKTVLGTAQIISVSEDDSLWVANCYTQLFYGYGGGKYADADAVKQSLTQVAKFADSLSLPVYMPRIGCGLGGLDWEKDVEPIVEELSEQYDRITFGVCDL